ncbi:hypothetical protein [Pseudanabaena sp. FACHB-2040]|uniref:hypothetical protein n=1 Tax=Pseudanabaena sp. FACHB-2040 TaxID=2692859 RepID=UPI0016894176|nr:hypothetical protein [Pseudanabaena sp. FACHB-2040]MBD2261358.1 hypothetical protein [Pseudanabaena sp. FACHB-2040]
MPFQLKTEFENVDDAIAYIKTQVAPELTRLAVIEETDLPAVKRNRDALKAEKVATQEKLTAAETKVSELEGKTASTADKDAEFSRILADQKAEFDKRLKEIEDREAVKEKQAAQNALERDAIAELSKGQYRVNNAAQVLALHKAKVLGVNGDLKRDEATGEVYVDLGDYKRQSIEQFVESVEAKTENQHLFKPKGGSGSETPAGAGSTGGGGGAGVNPFKKETWNMTEQTRLYRTNRPLYDRYKAESGK